MLIDDHHPTNVLHRLVLENCGLVKTIIFFDNASDALIYLNEPFTKENPKPNFIFLDINMPGLNGWEFLDSYKKLPDEKKSETALLMLSTSSHPEDLERAENDPHVKEFIRKPLTEERVWKVVNTYFFEAKEANTKSIF